jgi:hypothetical protein
LPLTISLANIQDILQKQIEASDHGSSLRRLSDVVLRRAPSTPQGPVPLVITSKRKATKVVSTIEELLHRLLSNISTSSELSGKQLREISALASEAAQILDPENDSSDLSSSTEENDEEEEASGESQVEASRSRENTPSPPLPSRPSAQIHTEEPNFEGQVHM